MSSSSQINEVFARARQSHVEELLQNLILRSRHASRIVDTPRRAPASVVVIVVNVDAVGERLRFDSDAFENADEEVVDLVIQNGGHLDELAVVVVCELSCFCK